MRNFFAFANAPSVKTTPKSLLINDYFSKKSQFAVRKLYNEPQKKHPLC